MLTATFLSYLCKKNCSVYIQCRPKGDIVVVDIKQHKSQLQWQQNLGHNGLELGLRKTHIEDLCVRWGVFKIGLFCYGQCAII